MIPDLSVVIPLYNEAPNVAELHRELTAALGAWGRPYELLFIDDGSADGTFPALKALQAGDPHLRVISFPAELRPDRSVRGRLRARQGSPDRDLGRRFAERSSRSADDGRPA